MYELAAETAATTAATEAVTVLTGMDNIAILALLVSGGTLALHIVTNVIGGTWKLKDEIAKKIESISIELRERMDSERREVGEMGLALRQRINEVDVKGLETYVRRDSFHQAMTQLHATIASLETAAEERSRRVEDKIDRLSERMGGPRVS